MKIFNLLFLCAILLAADAEVMFMGISCNLSTGRMSDGRTCNAYCVGSGYEYGGCDVYNGAGQCYCDTMADSPWALNAIEKRKEFHEMSFLSVVIKCF